MGGPYWARKDAAAWSAPKGGVEPGESAEAAAEREFFEETGLTPPKGPRLPLGDVRQRSGKTVRLWAVEADLSLDAFTPYLIDLPWPRGSGRTISIPELDRVEWVPVSLAAERLVAGQRPFITRLTSALATR